MISLPDFRYKQLIFYKSCEKDVLRFRADNLLVHDSNGGVALQHSCHRMFALFIIGDITITSVMLKKARKFGFPIILLSMNFRVEQVIGSPADGNTLLRKKQYSQPERDSMIAGCLIRQKILNQAALLRQLRYRSAEDNAALEILVSSETSNLPDRAARMGVEGHCSKVFFKTYFRNFSWTRREPRCRRDITNLLLDIGYTHLFNFIDALLSLYGFDVYCGVHHTFFYQRKSLVCDIMEPFRCIIDHRIRMAYSLGQVSEKDFIVTQGEFALKYESQGKYTKLFVKDILERKDEIFLFIQRYYRWFVRDKVLDEFPCFSYEGRD